MTGAVADPVEVGAVADEVGGRGEFATALRGHPIGAARAEPDSEPYARSLTSSM